MADGQERLISEGETLRFVYPLPVQDECVGCHSNAMPGSINGVIDIHFPVSKLRVPLEFTMHTVISVFVVVFLVLFVLVLANVSFLIAKPIIKLTQDIDAIIKSHDLTKRAQGGSFLWLHEVRSLAGNFNRMMAKLQHSHEELSRLSITDPLTGLKNRRHFEELFAEELVRAERYRHPVALIMIDLDGFKAVNDTWGHAVGDEMLRRVAQIMSSHVRTVDIVTRLGGDEFAVLVPETGRDGAANLAAKLSELISAERIEMDGGKFASVGASAGIATYPEDGACQEEVKKCADDAMYEEKKLRKAKRQTMRGD
ncbi:GGDEF domain protein (fragment) [Rhodospirillaceae bacterium LM-1]